MLTPIVLSVVIPRRVVVALVIVGPSEVIVPPLLPRVPPGVPGPRRLPVKGTKRAVFPRSTQFLRPTLGPVLTSLGRSNLHPPVTLKTALPPPIAQTLCYPAARVKTLISSTSFITTKKHSTPSPTLLRPQRPHDFKTPLQLIRPKAPLRKNIKNSVLSVTLSSPPPLPYKQPVKRDKKQDHPAFHRYPPFSYQRYRKKLETRKI